MNVGTHISLQSALMVIQGINVASLTGNLSFLPPKYSAIIILIVTTLQGAVGVYNHYFAPNGNKL